MSPEDEWRAWQAGNRKRLERSLDIEGLPKDTFDNLDPKASLYLGPRPTMKRAFVISPYAGDITRNVEYARKCMSFCFAGGYAPFAGHLLYPAILDDNDPRDRKFAMESAYEYLRVADVALCFMDLHISAGMRADLDAAVRLKIPIEYTSILGGIPTVDALHHQMLPHAHMSCALCQIESETK